MFAVIFAGSGVWEIIAGVIGLMPAGLAYAAGAGLIVAGCFLAGSQHAMTWADEAGLRVRGMFGTRVIPWSRVWYIRALLDGNTYAAWVMFVDGAVRLPGTNGSHDHARQCAADLTAIPPAERWLAIGLDLTAVPAPEGSRQTPLLVPGVLGYRARWELPGMTGTGRAGAPLFSSTRTLAPGDSARVVIIPQVGAPMTEWRLLGPGDRLRLFDGPRVCGHAVVRWSESTSLPLPVTDTGRFTAWARSRDDLPELA